MNEEKKINDIINRTYKRIYRKNILRGLILSPFHFFKHDYDYIGLSFIKKIFYLIKLYICFIFGLKCKKYSYERELCVSLVSYNYCSTGWNSVELTVGVGILKNWFYRLRYDGDCFI